MEWGSKTTDRIAREDFSLKTFDKKLDRKD